MPGITKRAGVDTHLIQGLTAMTQKHGRTQYPDMDAAELAIAIAGGCPAAESELVRRYRRQLIGRLTPETKDWARAEDLAHEALLIVLLRLRGDGIREPAKLSGYVHRTGYLVFLSWLRKKSNQFEYRESFDDQVGDSTALEDAIVAEQDGMRLRSVIASLPVERDRDILNWFLADQPKEVACEAFGLSSAHYDRVVSRARSRVVATGFAEAA